MNYHKLGTYSLLGEHTEFHKRRRRIKTTCRVEDSKSVATTSVQEDDVDNEYEYDEQAMGSP
jgi:hypothetical protein